MQHEPHRKTVERTGLAGQGMNLLMLSDVYFPRVNGVSTSIRTFAEALSQLGHKVTLVVPDYGAASGQGEYGSDGD